MLKTFQKKVSVVKTYNMLYKVVVDTIDADIFIDDINAYICPKA